MDKTGRNGLRVGDILSNNFIERYNNLKSKHFNLLKQYDFEYNIEEAEEKWLQAAEYLKGFNLIDGEYYINQQIADSKRY